MAKARLTPEQKKQLNALRKARKLTADAALWASKAFASDALGDLLKALADLNQLVKRLE